MTKKSIWGNIRDYFQPAPETVTPGHSQKLRLSGRELRIPLSGYQGYRIEMGKQTLILSPDPGVTAADNKSPCDFILFDPERHHSGIAHFQRLSPGSTLAIDSKIEYQEHVFSSPRDAFRRKFSVSHTGDSLVFRDPISEPGTYVSLSGEPQEIPERVLQRRAALKRVLDIFGGPLEPLSPTEATATLKQVNALLMHETGHRKDALGNPGGVQELPDNVTPVIIGDLHARIDNLLTILSQNAVLDSLENGTAALVFLGDAVHSEEPGRLEEMESSLLIMDLIFRLKLRFPDNVFYIIGNHDSFFHELMKQGIPQGLLWEKHVASSRGEEYKTELQLFYQQSPLLVLSKDFIACHAGPARRKVSRQVLVDAHQFPDIVHDMTWSRVRTTAFPAGYTRSDVRQFRKGLEVGSNTPFIVGHHPCSIDETLWLNVGHINQHHVIISSRPDRVGMFTCFDGQMVPQVHPVEALTTWLNEQASVTETH
ncbi:MAG: metallophosphoesterase [Gammaproteobacteria bacterium]|nr:metallophosphoesterase [Gammaproteobacteria bacterium]